MSVVNEWVPSFSSLPALFPSADKHGCLEPLQLSGIFRTKLNQNQYNNVRVFFLFHINWRFPHLSHFSLQSLHLLPSPFQSTNSLFITHFLGGNLKFPVTAEDSQRLRATRTTNWTEISRKEKEKEMERMAPPMAAMTWGKNEDRFSISNGLNFWSIRILTTFWPLHWLVCLLGQVFRFCGSYSSSLWLF